MSLWRVARKTAGLFVVFNLLYAFVAPLEGLQQINVYNTPLVPGRERLPYAENPAEAYSVTLSDPAAMLATHHLAADAPHPDEFRVFLLGDSGVWGWLLAPDETLSACLNRQGHTTRDGRRIRAYNLGYPLLNVVKDRLILEAAWRYEPDMVVWFVTLAALYADDSLERPLLQANAATLHRLAAQDVLGIEAAQLPSTAQPDFLDRTIIGERRALADWLRLQVYGLAWAATGVDHRNPEFFTPARYNLRASDDYEGFARDIRAPGALLWPVLRAGARQAEAHDAGMLLINEPIFQSDGLNSDQRYNFYYPRAGYDWYREALADNAPAPLVDLWDAMPPEAFTDSALHLNAAATCDLAARVGEWITHYAD